MSFIFAAVLPLAPQTVMGGTYAQSVHGDRTKLLKGCGSCHKGHGVHDQPMLPKEGEEMCFQCHGNTNDVSEGKQIGILSQSAEPKDIRGEFSKPFRHVLGPKGIHTPVETLPEIDPKTQRHVGCGDCHDIHREPKQALPSGGSGRDKKRTSFRNLSYEYELCYRCHSKSKNMPLYSTDKQDEFNPANRSYHPLEASGRPEDPAPSLLPPYSSSSILSCTDCHGNSDPNGPQGAHGSTYESLLVANYVRGDGSDETPFTYGICYRCHNRESVLSNESFLQHKRHIVDLKTSCFTCHDSHGSKQSPYLIRFNKDPRFTVVTPGLTGDIRYEYHPGGMSECYLTCHGVTHNPLPVKTQSPLRSPFPMNPQGLPQPYVPGGRR